PGSTPPDPSGSRDLPESEGSGPIEAEFETSLALFSFPHLMGRGTASKASLACLLNCSILFASRHLRPMDRMRTKLGHSEKLRRTWEWDAGRRKMLARLSIKVQSQPIVDRLLQILPRSQIALGSLDGSMAEQELNLLQVPAGCAAELRAGPPHIVGGQLIDKSDLPRVLGHDVPD